MLPVPALLTVSQIKKTQCAVLKVAVFVVGKCAVNVLLGVTTVVHQLFLKLPNLVVMHPVFSNFQTLLLLLLW
jgi:hypothetical protein